MPSESPFKEWVADIWSFKTPDRLSYYPMIDGDVIVGLTINASYQKPPGKILGLWSEQPKNKQREVFKTVEGNVKMVLAFWETEGILIDA